MIQDDIIRLIVIEESANDAEVILNSLRKARYPIRPRHVEDSEDLEKALAEAEHPWDLIISVPQVGEFSVTEVCDIVALSKQDIPIIVLSDKMEGKTVADLLNVGARQVIPSGNDVCLQVAVGRELENLTERRKRKHVEQLYRETQRHNKMLLQTSRDAIAYIHDGMHIHANRSYWEMFGYSGMDEMEGLPVMDLIVITDQSKFKDFMREFMADEKEEDREVNLEGLKSNSKRFKLKMEVSRAIYDSERCVQVIIRDLSQIEELDKLKDFLSQRDQLTGLFNRQHFITLLEKALRKAMEAGTRSVLLYIALDNFNSVRETVGVGSDSVVKNIGQVLNGLAKDGALARFEDSVFTLLLGDKDKEYGAELADKLCKAVEATVTEVGSQSVITTCSIGIAPVLAASANPQDVLGDAHKASLIVTKRGGNGHEIYKAVIPTGTQTTKAFSDIAKLIETSIEENRLSLRYQPIVSLHGETQEIYEVYLRMVDPQGQPVPTGTLFTAAEKANLTIHLDKWVLKEALKVLMQQQAAGHETYFFLKLSDQAIRDENIVLYIRKLLKSTQLPGERLIIEISESIAISQVTAALNFIKGLKTLGCKAALEHFGTGLNNSATTLKHLPVVDYVKIDSSYSKGLAMNVENQKAVKDIVKMAHDMEKLTIAEAVEDANSLTVLWQSEVDFAEGHYIQEPNEELGYDFAAEDG
ncbi:MAG: hypothetical protein BWK79_04630 [Beggiatoa sp. IS2]|nr:MAG: hypothetical protein BWK79_04630 [Beggiatoa sp. IS2]